MLRVGLTGGLGSGKSTVAQMFAAHGAYILSADEIGRELMQPGQAVYAAIVAKFGNSIINADGLLDRPALARIAFGEGRIDELNAIVHPATLAHQKNVIAEIAARNPDVVVIVESALIFETKHAGDGPADRFDRIVLVAASEDLKIARFIERSSNRAALSDEDRTEMRAEATRRLSRQIADEEKISLCDHVLRNNGSLEALRAQVDALWPVLHADAAAPSSNRQSSIK